MKNWWIQIGCFLTGWNSKILNSCTEASRKQLKKYSAAMLILIILWFFIGYSFAARYVQLAWWGCLCVAIVFVVIVVQIERQIILTVGRNYWLALFRVLLALMMAVLGSTILDQMIFKDDIAKKMVEIVDEQVKEQLPNRLNNINTRLGELQTDIDSLNKRNLDLSAEIYKHPTINTVSTSTTNVKVPQPDGTVKTVPQVSVSTTPIINPKTREVDNNNKHLDELQKQQTDYTQRKLDAESSLRTELKSKQGFLEELSAIVQILKEKPIALGFYILLFGFFMFLELFVVTSKFGDKKSDYDLVIEHQLEIKRRQLDELKKK